MHTAYEGYATRDYHTLWSPEPPCDTCEKTGILLEKNFQQKPICVDDECYKKTTTEQRKQSQTSYATMTAKISAEQEKIYSAEPDVRHWRLALYGFFDTWDLSQLLGVKGAFPAGDRSGAIWKKVLELSEEELKKLLIRKAVEKIMTKASQWEQNREVKEWAVKEFNLKFDVFLAPKEVEGNAGD